MIERDPFSGFHPAVRRWFEGRFPEGPSPPQLRGWPAIRSGRHVLIAAPTGSGKTLAAFLAAIDDLVRLGLTEDGGEPGTLPDETRLLPGHGPETTVAAERLGNPFLISQAAGELA